MRILDASAGIDSIAGRRFSNTDTALALTAASDGVASLLDDFGYEAYAVGVGEPTNHIGPYPGVAQ